MFRITGKENVKADSSPRKPVILGHGKFMDSTSWFKSGGGVENVVPLPLQLYDAGFDVWLSNARGTKYSLGHDILRTIENNENFWYWTYAEFAKFDATAQMKTIKKVTGAEQVSYVGYHWTSTAMFMQLAMWEDKMTDLERFVAIDPCLYEPIKLLPYD